uniref:Uncharacterized protein n=1 Tax=Panagrolaimus davidi TaxID=227884 RepID=A0A914QAJ3_9BILA
MRQQETSPRPSSVAQFRASQHLLNPNKRKAPSTKKVFVKKKKATVPQPRKGILKVPDRVYSDDEDFDGNQSDGSQTSAVSDASVCSRRSSRTRRAPPSHQDYVRTDTRVSFNLNGGEEDIEVEEIQRALQEQNELYNYDPSDVENEEVLVEDSANIQVEEEEEHAKRPKTKSSASTRRAVVNPPDLFFIGRCSTCVFAASYLDVTTGIVMKGSTVSLPVYGPSQVIYDGIETEIIAEDECKKYARGMGLKYGRASGRYIVFLSSAPERGVEENGDRIYHLEEENRTLRIELNTLKNRFNSLEQEFRTFRDEINAGRTIVPETSAQVQEANIDSLQRSTQSTPQRIFSQARVVAANINSPQRSTQSTPQRIFSQARVVATYEIADGPTWTWMSEEAARELRGANPDQKAFIRAIYKNMFNDIHSFHELPANMKKEFEKICMLLISPVTEGESNIVKKVIADEIKYQKGVIRTKLTAPKTAAVAMIDRAVPLVKQGDVWVPQGSVRYQHLGGANVRQWPLLFKLGSMADTMYAERKNPDNERSHWFYFIITRDGVLIPCSKE